MNWDLYPSDILKPTTPYVYFNDAPEDILNVVRPELNQSLNAFMSDTGETNIAQAFSFLKAAIASERAKENAFIQYLKDKTKGTIELKIPSLDEPWSNFVLELQRLLDFGNLGIKDLQNEYDRLVRNKASYDKSVTEGVQDARYMQDTLRATQQDLKNLLDTIRGDKLISNRVGTQVLQIIVKEFGADLLDVTGEKLTFNKSELMALLLSLAQMISQNFQTKKQYIKSHGTDDEKKLIEHFTRADALDDDLKKSMQTVIDQFKMFPSIRTQMVRNYGLLQNKHQTISAKRFIRSDGSLRDSANELTNELFNVIKQYEIPRDTFKLVQSEPTLAEIRSLINALSTGALTNINPGSINAKPDNVIAYITGDLSKLDPLNDPTAKKIIAQLEDINKLIEDNMLNKANGGLNSINTAEYYRMRADKWEELKHKISDAINQLKDTCDFLSSCFIIEDSTKNYLSLYTQKEAATNDILSGPHGGSLGSRLEDQLNKIEQLSMAGQITMIDKRWLTAAIINSGPGMIAEGQRHKLEDYLAIFAAMLLFDSQISIAQDAVQMMTTQSLNNTSVFNIHLFSVNGGYYPLSYVLKLTYDSLVYGLEEARTQMTTQGVEVDIYGFVAKPQEYGKEMWQQTAEAALKTTKLKMRFMVKLMNVIQNLLQIN